MKATGNAMWEMRIAIMWFFLFSVNSLCTAVMASLTGSHWATLDAQSKFMICLMVTLNWTGTIMAYISKQSQRIQQGKSFSLGGDDTTITTKTDITKQ